MIPRIEHGSVFTARRSRLVLTMYTAGGASDLQDTIYNATRHNAPGPPPKLKSMDRMKTGCMSK